jgi:hypothetical protein
MSKGKGKIKGASAIRPMRGLHGRARARQPFRPVKLPRERTRRPPKRQS